MFIKYLSENKSFSCLKHELFIKNTIRLIVYTQLSMNNILLTLKNEGV